MVRFHYHGKDRLVEPHDHGILKGSVQLLSWQVAGSSSRPLPNWLLTKVDEMADLVLLDQTFRAGGLLPPASISNGTNSSSESNQPTVTRRHCQNRKCPSLATPSPNATHCRVQAGRRQHVAPALAVRTTTHQARHGGGLARECTGLRSLFPPAAANEPWRNRSNLPAGESPRSVATDVMQNTSAG